MLTFLCVVCAATQIHSHPPSTHSLSLLPAFISRHPPAAQCVCMHFRHAFFTQQPIRKLVLLLYSYCVQGSPFLPNKLTQAGTESCRLQGTLHSILLHSFNLWIGNICCMIRMMHVLITLDFYWIEIYLNSLNFEERLATLSNNLLSG